MKLIKTASGNQIKMSKSEWQSIGKTAGWLTNNWEYDKSLKQIKNKDVRRMMSIFGNFKDWSKSAEDEIVVR